MPRRRLEVAIVAIVLLSLVVIAARADNNKPRITLTPLQEAAGAVRGFTTLATTTTGSTTTTTTPGATTSSTAGSVAAVAAAPRQTTVATTTEPTTVQTGDKPTPTTTATTVPATTTTTTTTPTTTIPTTNPTTSSTTTTTTTTTTLPPVPTIPAPVSNLTGNVLVWTHYGETLSDEQVQLSWVDQAVNETGYRVYEDYALCGPPAGIDPTVPLATLPPNSTTTVVVAHRYSGRYCDVYLRVVAFNAAGESGPARYGYPIRAPLPNAPVIVTYAIIPATPTVAHLSWRHTAINGFETLLFTLTDALGAPLVPLNNLGPPFPYETYPPVTKTLLSSSSTASLWQYDVNVTPYSCVRVRATNSYQSAYDYNTSTLSPGCIPLS